MMKLDDTDLQNQLSRHSLTMTTTNSKIEPVTNKRVTKTDLNKLAKSHYGEEVYCEHVRSGQRGWYLYRSTEQNFLGTNATEAFNFLQSQKNTTGIIPTLVTKAKVSKVIPALLAKTKASEVIPMPSMKTKVPDIPVTYNTMDTEKMSEKPLTPPKEMLEILFEKFPNTFFREPEKIRPLQKYIHKKIRRTLNEEYTKEELSTALAIYTQSIDYCKKLMLGGQRIDLEGNPCNDEVSEQHQEDAKARIIGEKAMRSAKKKKVKTPKAPRPIPQIDQLISGKMEVNVKVSELPADSKTTRNGWEEFIIDTNGQMVKTTVRPRTWKKLQKAANEYAQWVASIRGKMGPQVKGGFELLMPTIQIFEKQPKKVLSEEKTMTRVES
ncbi:ProQ/FinO family protein [Candidatus Parabeggiatoa sp. HSG14]|uniref:ProQ/FinO family protein n=1 Tax=Candidatus Parabeggiatoa sp. HSG14 TaxID=3055593 RepID=UPI0025A82BF2|nr:ProQ/FinO family protein [Thiotrichales bacterium HSG14]